MIRYILRKTVYKEYDRESQDIVFDLYAHKLYIWIFVLFAISIILLSIMSSIFIGTVALTLARNILQVIIICISIFVICAIFYSVSFDKLSRLIYSLATNIYFYLYTKKGNAISSCDFNKLSIENIYLYNCLKNYECKGECHRVCFKLLETLKKGSIQIVCIWEFQSANNAYSSRSDKEFTLHVLYVHSGWCFDTYSDRQFPLHYYYKAQKVKMYKEFTYEDIQGKNFATFFAEIEEDVKVWAEENNSDTFYDCC